jgi:hypothetical protein
MGNLEFTLYFRKTLLEKEAVPFGWKPAFGPPSVG